MPGIDAQTILEMRLQAALRDLGVLEKSIAAETALHEKLGPRFAALIQSLRDDIKELEKAARKEPDSLADCWKKLRSIVANTERVAEEYLRCLQGTAIRKAELDGGYLEISDFLIHRIGREADIQWPRLTILSGGEFLSGMTDVIGARFPSFDVWNLPVAVHEFGHFLFEHLTEPMTKKALFADMMNVERKRIYKILKGKVDEDTVDREMRTAVHHLHELFADLFAVFTVGPAYLCTCVLLRFDPGTANDETAHHPSDAARIAAMMRGLEVMDKETFRALIDSLRKKWAGSLQKAGVAGPAAGAFKTVEKTADGILAVLRRNLPGNVRYQSWPTARALSEDLSEKTPVDKIDLDGVMIADVLNAAWLARLENDPASAVGISSRAMAACQRITRAK